VYYYETVKPDKAVRTRVKEPGSHSGLMENDGQHLVSLVRNAKARQNLVMLGRCGYGR
jgi:hypothetical protein